MRSLTFLLATSVLVSMAMLVGVAMADDTGVGVCIVGNGASLNDAAGAGPYVGLNVNTTSGPSTYSNQSGFYKQCCAETGQEPDCFDRVA